jgi:hypothetical protein
MACEQIAVAGIQISQVVGSREANISTGKEVGRPLHIYIWMC